MSDLELVSEEPSVEKLVFNDYYSMTVQRKLGLPKTWRWWKVESVANGTLIHGNVPTTTRGGKLKWPSKATDSVLVITQEEVAATEKAWEAETGRCARCSGHGKEWRGWARDTGVKVATCRTCNGSGKTSLSGDPTDG